MSALSPEAALAARTLRILTVDAVRQAGIGHVGLPLGCADLAVVLFGELLRHDPSDPAWPDRDRFVLSGGHGSMLLYGLLHLCGYPLSMDEIRRFRQLGSATPGHPEYGHTAGVETTTGPLGQGVGNAVGMAIAERMLAARFGPELVDHRTYVLASDGDMMEGVASEAASLAGHLGLGRLIVLYDDNRVTIDGSTDLSFSEEVSARFQAYGWEVQRVDGHDMLSVRRALVAAQESETRPHLIVCRTHIGFGSPAVDTAAAHGHIPEDAVEATRQNLGWTLPPFEIPAGAREAFRANAERGRELRKAWDARRTRALRDERVSALWKSHFDGPRDSEVAARLPDFKGEKPMATRQASGRVINAIAPAVPGLVGGSADLAGSNLTAIKDGGTVERGKFEGRNLHFGVREHGMAAIASGIALHGGLQPYVGTFLVFSDYMRPSVRLAALMGLPVVYVFTHDSIFVGEDGPTHQPVEHLAALRAIPNLAVWRPGDARETAVAWRAALANRTGPSALVLTRQPLPTLEVDGVEAGAARGGWVAVREQGGAPELCIVGTGSETALAVDAARALAGAGRRVRAVSLPSLELFLAQDAAWRESVLPAGVPRLVVEAGVSLGLAPLVGPGDRFHGMSGFGASAPYKALATHFGFTSERVGELAREMLR